MDVILHVGAHRTATTTFQAYLRRNRAALLGLGIEVWEPERMRGGLVNGLTGPAGPLTPEAVQQTQRTSGRIRMQMAQLDLAGVDRLLVSEENMIGSVRDNLRRGRLYPQVVPRLARFVGPFGARCSRVVIGVRCYAEYWSSALAYALPGGMPLPDPAQLDRLVTQPRRWRQVIEDVAATFPYAECLVLPFDAVAGRPEVQLAAMTGEPVPMLAEPRRWLHASPGQDQLRQVLLDRREPEAAARILAGNGRWQPFGADHIAVFRDQFAQDMEWLRAGAGGIARLIDTTPPGDVWPDPAGLAPPGAAGDRGAPDGRGYRIAEAAGLA